MRFLGFFCFLFLTNLVFSQKGFVSPTCYNSSGNEFGLRFIEGKMFFISDAKDSVGAYRKDFDAKRNFTDIFEVKGCDKELASLLKADINQIVSINSEWYDGPVSYSKNDSIFFFSNSNEGLEHGKMGIYWCKKNINGAFSTPVAFSHNSNVYSCMHPFYDDATNYLYFVSDIQNDSTGFDLYRVLFQNGKSGEVEALKNINTTGNELFPIVFNKMLYFTSNRSTGLGGMDIYSSSDLQNVTLLDEPINSVFDDLSIFFTEDNKGYLSTNRGNAQKNGDDINQFYIPKLKKQKIIEPSENKDILAELDQLYTKLVKENDPNALLIEKAMQRIKEQESQLQILENDYENSTLQMMNYVDTSLSIPFEEKVKLYEQVITENHLVTEDSSADKNTATTASNNTNSITESNSAISDNSVDNNTTSKASNNTNSVIENYQAIEDHSGVKNTVSTASNKTIILDNISKSTLSDSVVAAFISQKQKIENSSDKIALEKDFVQENVIPFVTEDRNIDLKILSEHLKLTDQEVKTLMAYDYPITLYFDFDKSIIKKDEEEKINYLLELIQSLEGTIRIEGHTDSKGNDSYNLNLSAKRSKKVYQYLMRYGISKENITLVNYGETQSVADNSTAEGRALNRRVVIVLLPKSKVSEIKN